MKRLHWFPAISISYKMIYGSMQKPSNA